MWLFGTLVIFYQFFKNFGKDQKPIVEGFVRILDKSEELIAGGAPCFGGDGVIYEKLYFAIDIIQAA